MKSSESGVGWSSQYPSARDGRCRSACRAAQSGLPGPHVLALDMLTADTASLDGAMLLEVGHMVKLGS